MILPMVEGQIHCFPGNEITWAGDCPWTGSYCFGTEHGRILFHGHDSEAPFPLFAASLAEDAINGVAFFHEFIGVSTRSELNIYRRDTPGTFELVGTGPGGAHGILSMPSGQFVAPMGTEGIFCFDTALPPHSRAWIEHANGAKHDYYSLRYLACDEDQSILACAARNDGLLTVRFDKNPATNQIIALTAPDIDFIDVCSLKVPEMPFAVAALCSDRSLIFVRNALLEENPQTVKFDQFRGVPHSILSSLGHLFVLTNQELVVLPDIGSRFASGEPLDRPTYYRHKEVHAVEAFVSQTRELLILTDEGVNVFDISKLVRPPSAIAPASEAAGMPIWSETHIAPELLKREWHRLVA